MRRGRIHGDNIVSLSLHDIASSSCKITAKFKVRAQLDHVPCLPFCAERGRVKMLN